MDSQSVPNATSISASVSEQPCDTISLDKTFYTKDEHSYSLLEREDITNSLVQNDSICIDKGGFVNKIVLVDFPPGQYIYYP